MSITLKRPMFRKGGEVNEGIMELAQPRTNYRTGTTEEQIKEIFETSGLTPSGKSYAETAMRLANLGKPSGGDLLTNVLIQGGLRGMSTAGKGGTLANLASAFEAPVSQALKQRQAGKTLGTAGALKGLELGIKKDIADRTIDARLKNKQFESGTIAAITKEVQSALGKDVVGDEARRIAVNIAPKVAKARTTTGVFYQGILKMDDNDKSKPDLPRLKGQPDGAVFINPYNNLFYIVDGGKLVLADQNTLGKIAPDEGE
tara:strand:- start:1467 stop:2243 length:777 start_codon:yes stop_codon:yes gene_type:complete